MRGEKRNEGGDEEVSGASRRAYAVWAIWARGERLHATVKGRADREGEPKPAEFFRQTVVRRDA